MKLLLDAWMILLILGSPLISRATDDQSQCPQPPYPYLARERHEQGNLVYVVTFDQSGDVAKCRVENPSPGTINLEASTTAFIQKNWHNLSLAGTVQKIPITYALHAPDSALTVHLGTSSPDGKEVFPIPPFPDYDRTAYHQGTVLLAVTFASDGRVSRCQVVHSTATSGLEEHTASFVLKNWRSVALAGTTKQFPFEYGPPKSPGSASPWR